MMPAWPLLPAFLVASFVLAVTPGPGVLYIVTRSLAEGRRSGLASVAGVALGNLGNAVGASVGLAALFMLSSSVFMIVRYAGALYLIYLGIQALRTPQAVFESMKPKSAQPGKIFRGGVLVALLNPKTAVFFAAFLPQFVDAESAPVTQSVVLGAIFVGIAALTDAAYAVAAGAVAPALARTQGVRALGRYLAGSTFIGLGVFTAISGPRGAK